VTTVITAQVHCQVRRLARRELESWAQSVFEYGQLGASKLTSIHDAHADVWLEQGSLKGRIAILASLTCIYIGIGNYGDFVQGVRTIAGQARDASDFVIRSVDDLVGTRRGRVTYRRRQPGLPGSLERLFDSVSARRLTPSEATERAMALIRSEAETMPMGMEAELQAAIADLGGVAWQPPDALRVATPPPVQAIHVAHEAPARGHLQPRRPPPPPRDRTRVHVWLDDKGKRRLEIR